MVVGLRLRVRQVGFVFLGFDDFSWVNEIKGQTLCSVGSDELDLGLGTRMALKRWAALIDITGSDWHEALLTLTRSLKLSYISPGDYHLSGFIVWLQ